MSARQGAGRSHSPAPGPKVAVPGESLTFNIPQLIHQPGSALRQTSCRLMMDVRAAGRLQSAAKPCSAWKQGAGEGSPLTLSPGMAACVGNSGLCGFSAATPHADGPFLPTCPGGCYKDTSGLGRGVWGQNRGEQLCSQWRQGPTRPAAGRSASPGL